MNQTNSSKNEDQISETKTEPIEHQEQSEQQEEQVVVDEYTLGIQGDAVSFANQNLNFNSLNVFNNDIEVNSQNSKHMEDRGIQVQYTVPKTDTENQIIP